MVLRKLDLPETSSHDCRTCHCRNANEYSRHSRIHSHFATGSFSRSRRELTISMDISCSSSVFSAISEKSPEKRTVRLKLQFGKGVFELLGFELLSLRATEFRARRIRATESSSCWISTYHAFELMSFELAGPNQSWLWGARREAHFVVVARAQID